MRIIPVIACIALSGCSDKNLKSPFTSTTTTDRPFSLSDPAFGTQLGFSSAAFPSRDGDPDYPSTGFDDDEIEPEEAPLPSSHSRLVDISEFSSTEWFDRVCRDLEPFHRGDWTTWIGFGGPSMVDYLTRRIRIYTGMKGVFVLAGELASRPVPLQNDPMNITEALGDVCENFDEFTATAIREPRISQDGLRSQSTLIRINVDRAYVELAPFANLNLVCPLASSASSSEVVAMIANHRIARRLIFLGNQNIEALDSRPTYRPRTDSSLSEQLRWLVSTPVSTIALGFRVTYDNDNAIGDGVYRDWIVKMTGKILESVDLFKMGEDGKYRTLLDSEFDMDTLWKFRGVGRLLALTMIEGISIGAVFNHGFYSVLLGKSSGWTMDDLVFEDQVFHESMEAVLQCKITGNCDSFLLEFDTKDGRNLRNPNVPVVSEPVTNENVEEYVALTVSYELYRARERIYRQLYSGFSDVFPRSTFSNFLTAQNLAEIFKGSTEINITELKDNISYSGFRPNDEVLEWFWRFIQEGGSQRAMQLIHFTTGLKSLPIGGLSKLPHRISFEKYPYSRERMYPKSHLCYAKFDLPNYATEAELRLRVAEAIVQETLGMV